MTARAIGERSEAHSNREMLHGDLVFQPPGPFVGIHLGFGSLQHSAVVAPTVEYAFFTLQEEDFLGGACLGGPLLCRRFAPW
jgi:hypothetical protein